MTTVTEYDFDRTCRSCLCTSSNLKSLFETYVSFGDKQNDETKFSGRRTRRSGLSMHTDEQRVKVHEVIGVFSDVQISFNDGLPQTICDQCIASVQNAFFLKKTCEESDVKLREYLRKKIIKKEDPVQPIDIKDETNDSSDNELDRDYNPADDNDNSTMDGRNDPLFEYLTLNELKTDLCEIKMPKDDDIVDETSGNDNHAENIAGPIMDNIDEENLVKMAKFVDGRYICPICSRSLADRSTLTLHLRLHTGKKLKHCTLCNRGFSKQSHLNRHMNSHNKKIYSCEYCDQTFDTYQARRMHATAEHWEAKRTGEMSSTKRKQGSSTSSSSKKDVEEISETETFYEVWQRSTHKKCICNICENSFDRIVDLQKHLVWHADEDNSLMDVLSTRTEIMDSMATDLRVECHELTGEMTRLLIKSRLQNKWDMPLFYQISNEMGWELSISDSETETEAEVESSDASTYLCSKCKQPFDRLYKIMQHMKVDHFNLISADFADFRCKHCKHYFPNDQLLRKHVRSQCGNTKKKFFCSICNHRFMWHNNLEVHIQKVHTTKTNESAPSETISLKKLDEIRPREKTYTCGICTKAFYRQEHLERHKKIHSPAEKQFCCDICDKKFNRKDNLKSHMRIHRPEAEKDNINKHLCVYCGKSFSNSSNLIVHMRRHTGEKPYKCDLCDKGFPRSSDLQCHRRTHTGEKPCLCTICGKGFSRSNKLVRHMRIHTGIRPYKCTYCDRAFTQSNDLTLHIRRHTGDKPYVCGVCGDRFIQGTALAQHRRAQGHFEETNQSAPYSSISVNNPNRFTNANRVNRIGMTPPLTTANSVPLTETETLATASTSSTDATPTISLSISSNGQPLSNVVVTQAHSSSDYTVNEIGTTTTASSLISPFIISQSYQTPVNYLSASRFLGAPIASQTVSSSSVNATAPSELSTSFIIHPEY